MVIGAPVPPFCWGGGGGQKCFHKTQSFTYYAYICDFLDGMYSVLSTLYNYLQMTIPNQYIFEKNIEILM